MFGSVGGELQWAGRLGPNRVAAVLAVPFLYIRIRTFTAPSTPSSPLAEGQLANADQNRSPWRRWRRRQQYGAPADRIISEIICTVIISEFLTALNAINSSNDPNFSAISQ